MIALVQNLVLSEINKIAKSTEIENINKIITKIYKFLQTSTGKFQKIVDDIKNRQQLLSMNMSNCRNKSVLDSAMKWFTAYK